MTGIAKRTIYDNLKIFKHQGNIARKDRSDRRLRFNENYRKQLALLVKRQNNEKGSLNENGGERYKFGYKFLVPKIIPFLISQHRENMITWCQEDMRTRWNPWIFSDETRVELYSAEIGRWSKERPRNPRAMVISDDLGCNYF